MDSGTSGVLKMSLLLLKKKKTPFAATNSVLIFIYVVAVMLFLSF